MVVTMFVSCVTHSVLTRSHPNFVKCIYACIVAMLVAALWIGLQGDRNMLDCMDSVVALSQGVPWILDDLYHRQHTPSYQLPHVCQVGVDEQLSIAQWMVCRSAASAYWLRIP